MIKGHVSSLFLPLNPSSSSSSFIFFTDKYSSKSNIIQRATKLKLTAFLRLTTQTFLIHYLRRQGPLTVFAPSNIAWYSWLNSEEGKRIRQNDYVLRLVLLCHIVGGKWPTVFLKNEEVLESLAPLHHRTLRVKFYDDQAKVSSV